MSTKWIAMDNGILDSAGTESMPPLANRVFTEKDRKNFIRTELTRFPTSGLTYSFFNREQDRYINQKIRERIIEKLKSLPGETAIEDGADFEFVNSKEKTAPIRTDLEAKPTAVGKWFGGLYDKFGKAWGGVTSKLGNVGKLIDDGTEIYDTSTYHVRYKAKDGSIRVESFSEGISTGEKYGRTVAGFATGAITNNLQRSILEAHDMGDNAPWKNKDGSTDHPTLLRWVAKEAFRGVLRGAGEDVFASSPVYNKFGKWWIEKCVNPASKYLHNTFPNVMGDASKGKTLFQHMGEWMVKFYKYNVSTYMWRDIYRNTLEPIERWIGGEKNNPRPDEPKDERPLLKRVSDGVLGFGRGIIRAFIIQFAPMMTATNFFWLPGYYGTILSGGGSGNQDTYKGGTGNNPMPSKSRYGEGDVNFADGVAKKIGKAYNDFGANVADPVFEGFAKLLGKKPEELGLDGFGREALDSYARYGTYFAVKGWAQGKWACKSAEEGINNMIDGFFGIMFNSLLPWRWSKVKESVTKMKDGAKKYGDVLAFRDPDLIEAVKKQMAEEHKKSNPEAKPQTESTPAKKQNMQEEANNLAADKQRHSHREQTPVDEKIRQSVPNGSPSLATAGVFG